MNLKKFFCFLILSFLVGESISIAQSNLISKEVEYYSNGLKMKGYLVYDASIEGKRPGILVVHEWWGHNQYVRKRAEMLAGLGYTAFALDLYGDGKLANHPNDANTFASEVMSNMETAKERFQAAYDILNESENVEAGQIGAIGYCFGGGVVLNMARLGVDLKGVVSFHGSLTTDNPAELNKVKSEILVCNGEADSFITKEDIINFNEEMKNAGVDYNFINYPNALHAFTNPEADVNAQKFGLKIAYNKEADEKSWIDMQDFFKRVFNK